MSCKKPIIAQIAKLLKLLHLYKKESDKVSIHAIDPVKNPVEATKFNIQNENTLLIQYENKKTVLLNINELNITNEILKFISRKKRILCFTQSHGEFLFDQGNNGLSFLKERMLESGYQLSKLDLLKDEIVDCSVILSLGVKKDFFKTEIKRIKDFLVQGGGFVTTFGPSFNNVERINYRKLLNWLDVDFKNSVIIDRLSNIYKLDASINVIDNFLGHKITKNFKQRIYMPLSNQLINIGKAKPLYFSSKFPASWAETNLKNLAKGNAKFDTSDLKNNLTSAMASEKNHFRAVVFGSEQFILNSYQGQSSNFNFFLNSLDWTLKEDKLISLDRPKLKNERLNLSAPALNTIFYAVIVFIPFLFFLVAGIIYKRNQRL